MSELSEWMGRDVTRRDSGSPRRYRVAGHSGDGRFAVLVDPITKQLLDPTASVAKLELVPEDRRTTGLRGYGTTSHISATSDEFLEWFAFVMLQAASLFEGVPSPGPANRPAELPDDVTWSGPDASRDELIRLLTCRGENPEGPVVLPALAYYDAALDWYRRDAEDDHA